VSEDQTTAVVQRYLDELAGDSLQANEVLDAVEERVLKALRAARPRTVRELFALASRHMRRELNDLARRLDEQPAVAELRAGLVWAPASSVSGLSPDGEREVFDLLRIQGMKQAEAAQVLGVSAVTVKPRLSRFVERMLTVVQTLHLQGRRVIDYLADAITAHRQGLPAPRLLPEG